MILDLFLLLRLSVALPLETNCDVALPLEPGQGLEDLEEALGVLLLEAANDPEDQGSRGHPHRSEQEVAELLLEAVLVQFLLFAVCVVPFLGTVLTLSCSI